MKAKSGAAETQKILNASHKALRDCGKRKFTGGESWMAVVRRHPAEVLYAHLSIETLMR
jgi:hypothetical protein